jgi:protein phosphatase
MAFKQQLVVALSEKGKRQENEDFIIPNSCETKSHVYVLCDGVGGNHKGEIASKLAAESIFFYLTERDPFLFQRKLYLDNCLKFAEENFSEYLVDHKESIGMATTVVCLEFIKKKAIGFWVGDSRIYHIRNNSILFKSKDHSLYQELKDAPETDQDTLKNFPYKNYILRAIKGRDQATQSETFVVSDIKKNDYFILLSDGILEAFQDDELIQLTNKYANNYNALSDEIRRKCEENSKDNYSIQIVKIIDK